ncbi:integrase [Actinoplanes sp. NPDC051494]|uniref:integrase n=1 Tax=Actinoplanes sp. NPDC051494 TaxID=3363907 RepID=UPI0037B4CF13
MTDPSKALNGPLTDPYPAHVAARLLDFFADTTPWPRRLWDVSSLLALSEAYEAGDWQRQNVLSAGAVSWYLHALERMLGPDQGLGDGKMRKELTQLLRSGLAPDSQQRRRLRQVLPLANAGYLSRWTKAVDGRNPPSAERLARAVASHLLDRGWSSGKLHRWVHGAVRLPGITLRDLLEQAVHFAESEDRDFEVMVPLLMVPDKQSAERSPDWLPAPAVSAWFHAEGFTPRPRHNGAFLYRVRAKDAVAAARRAGALVLRLEARSSFARNGGRLLQPVGRVWVGGYPEPLPLQSAPRGADVLSLQRERTLYSLTGSERLDDALELAASINGRPPAPAVSGGWTAVESLMYHPGDKADPDTGRAVSADRLAAVVACSWPRAELTALSYKYRPRQPDDLSSALKRACSSTERCDVMASALATGMAQLTELSDVAAAQRMSHLLASPFKELSDVHDVLAGALRRLYRQRNIVAHGGTTAAVALNATLRTVAPLIGAGLDRLVHASVRSGLEPLDLAARAENSLALVGDPLGPAVTRLLN